ncbi:MAG TPA: YceI family protein [Pseudonocardiaceae bacterium]
MATTRQVNIGPERGTLVLHTSRRGLASQAGHDLTIQIDRWSGTVSLGDDLSEGSVEVTIDTSSLRVTAGTGGVKPLSERDKREIYTIANKLIGGGEAKYVSSSVTAATNGGTVTGTLSLHGAERPVELTVTDLGGNHYRGTATIVQSEFGIKPYTGFLGALKVSDGVEVVADVRLTDGAAPAEPA